MFKSCRPDSKAALSLWMVRPFSLRIWNRYREGPLPMGLFCPLFNSIACVASVPSIHHFGMQRFYKTAVRLLPLRAKATMTKSSFSQLASLKSRRQSCRKASATIRVRNTSFI